MTSNPSEAYSELDVAVVGMAGRFPGAPHLRAYWENLTAGVESVRFHTEAELLAAGVSPDVARDPDYVPASLDLDDVDAFDHAFFGYSPREAATTDPQGRVFLECAWHALEDAGYPPDDCPGDVGVWASQSLSTYLLHHLHGELDRDDFILGGGNIPAVLGNANDFIATRVSYRLNLTGPSIDVQTACSSSLVAIHMARLGLLNGECGLALAGGSSIYLPQGVGYRYRDGLILSRDGHCRPFDADATGTLFGRGAGVVALKRLQDAVADGDRIRAVIRGSAVNNDGSRKVAFTAPSVRGQAKVVAEALADADVSADSIGYLEAHATGTIQGDPIEIAALNRAYDAHTDRVGYCAIGCVKSNIGHLDVASGVAGFVKTVLMLENEMLAPTLHYRRPNPEIDFERSPFKVQAELERWPRRQGVPRRAGVSSFGIGGTNAHVILEEAPLVEAPSASARPRHLVKVSAKSEEALARLVDLVADRLAETEPEELADVCFTANVGRSDHPHRVAVRGSTGPQLSTRLRRSTELQDPADAALPPGTTPKIAFLFTGQGAQSPGMARELYASEPVFRAELDRCDQVLRDSGGEGVLSLLYGDEGDIIHQTAYAQPALFAVEYSVAQLWRSWGVEPDVVLGHSLGELAAACCAGVFGVEDGLRLASLRGHLMQSLPVRGSMVAALTDETTVRSAMGSVGSDVVVAAVNGPASTVFSGEQSSVEALIGALSEMGVETKRLHISNAFHSPVVDPILGEFEHAVSEISLRPPEVELASNVTGEIASEEVTRPDYWSRHMREAVQFRSGIEAASRAGVTHFIEVGPHPTLLAMGQACLPAGFGRWLPSLRREHHDLDVIYKSLAALYADGGSIDWAGLSGEGRRVSLPGYPFEKTRHWVGEPLAGPGPVRATEAWHAILDREVRSPFSAGVGVEGSLSADSPAFVADHRVHEVPVFPMTGLLDLAISARTRREGRRPTGLLDVVVPRPLLLRPGSVRSVQVIFGAEGDRPDSFRIYTTDATDRDAAWIRHASGRIDDRPRDAGSDEGALEDARARCQRAWDVSGYYRHLAEVGLAYGPRFHGIRDLWSGNGEAVGRILFDGDARRVDGHVVHPATLDACLQVLMAAVIGPPSDAEDVPASSTMLPIALERLTLLGDVDGELWSHVRLRAAESSAEGHVADIAVFDAHGSALARIDGLVVRVGDAAAFAAEQIGDWTYRIDWRERPGSASEGERGVTMTPPELKTAADRRLRPLRDEYEMAAYEAVLPRLDALCAAYAEAAVLDLGVAPAVGDRLDADRLAAVVGVVERHRRLFARLLEIIAGGGALEASGDGWNVRRPFSPRGHEEMARELRAAAPSGAGTMLDMVAKCGEALADVLAGRTDPLDVLFPGGSARELENLYRNAPFTKVYNRLIAEAVQDVVAALPAGRTLRILEVGAGTGGTTAHVLPVLPPDRIHYTYTDVSPLFLANAKETFRDFDFVEYETLDAEIDPTSQGFELGSYDLVIASNVLHVTSDLRRTLRQVGALLAPAGMLVLVEGVARQAWVDLIFGLTEGWWGFRDTDLRASYPLISRDAWMSVLSEVGFEDPVAVPGAEHEHAIFEQAILAASKSRAPVARGSERDDAMPGGWLILTDEGGIGEGLRSVLEAHGEVCDVVDAPTGTPSRAWIEDMLHSTLDSGRYECRGIVHLWTLGRNGEEEPSSAQIEGALEANVSGLLGLAQLLEDGTRRSPPPIWLVTRGAQMTLGSADGAALVPAALWGLAKVVAQEHPELRCTRIDLDPTAGEAEAELLARELAGRGPEDQVVFREGRAYVPRLVRDEADSNVATGGAAAGPVRLVVTDPGRLDSLELVPLERSAPSAGEVEIRVHATGLNFKDVLAGMGMYRGDPGPLGIECAGEVIAIGPGVEGLAPGQRVVAYAPGSFATFVTARAELVAPLPGGLTYEEGATLVGAYLTAAYALETHAGLRAGERVLVHSATGGVGSAAVRLARSVGAEIFATAGTDEKRAILRSQGICHVMDSRSGSFADEVMSATDGAGVDVVLNALSGDLAEASLSMVGEGGRYVELGKLEIPHARDVAATRPDIAYFAIDVAADCEADPERMGRLLRELVGRCEAGDLAPLPSVALPLARAEDAFRLMARAGHTGKVVVVHDDPSTSGGAGAAEVREDGAYLITGGLGGLGLLFGDWLARRGARRIGLMSRRAPSTDAEEAIRGLEEAGAEVLVLRGDVSRAEDVSEALAALRGGGVPLRGVIQAAGVLDDGVLNQQSWSRFETVLRPKVHGSWNLHLATGSDPLDFFVMFSSLASVIGSPGQSNHVTANAFQDALAHYRRSRGLPALAINWGVWSEIGAAAERDVGARSRSRGLGVIPPAAGVRAFERVLGHERPQVVVAPIVWSDFADPSGAVPGPFLAEILVGTRASEEEAGKSDTNRATLKDLVERAPADGRAYVIEDFVRSRVAAGLGIEAADSIDPLRPLSELGLDSLMAVEMRNTLSAELELDAPLPATLFFDYPSVSAVAGFVAVEVLGLDGADGEGGSAFDILGSAARAEATPDNGGLDELGGLSAAEVAELLRRELEEAP